MIQKQKTNCGIFISGGGIPGLTLALLLGGLGLDVAICDPRPPEPSAALRPDGRTAALMAGSVNILKTAGVWDECATHGAALETLRIIEEGGKDGKPVQADFRAGDIGLPCFGVNMPNNILRAALFRRVAAHKKITFLKAEIENLNADAFGITLIVSGGHEIRSRILAGADGRASRTRTLAGIGTKDQASGQCAITCLITHSKPHDNISTEFHRPGGPFTLVPLPGKISSVVWVEQDGDADKFMKLRRQDFEAALQNRTSGMLGEIALATSPESWPLKTMRAASITAPRIALMAEAAHVLNPLGAQGLNLSLRDAAALAEEIADAARAGLDIGSAATLRRYAFRRRADIITRLLGTNGMNRMVSNDFSLLRGLRRAALQMIHSTEPLRRFAMHEGITPGYDDSRLAQGKEL
jgi:2-octaprenyl-6-methoxyphenol hydroxylase